ncbi:telomerase reverse transcriptase isoform X3 [Dromaius novaehollandiae]|uniref:telomerase reverse transcriptase isoform X3 n=1 Tax=Dromaius novaehollandiae TaxID=8790 RepID=UPI0031203DA2
MAGAGPFAAALTALQGCYAEAAPLETFIQRLRESGAGEAEVLQADDAPCYRTFVAQCVVCVPRGARSIPRPFTFQQLSSQSEVITRVIQRLCEKRKKNVLAYGYSLLDENSSHFRIMPSSNICSYLPNTATETLRISGLWETLLSRIGDDVMMYLLEHCAIFMLVPPSSCYQVCGQPIYELISNNVESSPLFVKQRYSKHRRNALFDYMQKRLMFHKKHLSKSHWWKCKRRPEAQVSSRGNQKTNKMQCLVSGLAYSAKDNFKASEQIGMVTEHLENQISPGLSSSATALSLKRKLGREQLKITAKRAKVDEKALEKEAWNHSPGINQSNSKRYGYVASHSVNLAKEKYISKGSDSDMSGPSLVHKSYDGKEKFSVKKTFLQGAQSNKPLKSSTEMQAESNRNGVETHTYKSQVDSVQMKPMEGISSKYRRLESPLDHLGKKLPNTVLHSGVYIERKSLLYSRWSFKECFPKWFLLNRLKGCQASGRRLVETIFLSQNLLEQKRNQSLPHHNWRKKRLPKRYWQMRNIFQKLVKNHGKCPYSFLLKKNCPIGISEANVGKADLPPQSALPEGAEVHKQVEEFGKESAKRTTSSSQKGGRADVPNDLCTPLPKSLCGKSKIEEQNPGEVCDSAIRELLKQHSSHWQVYVFVRQCLERVIPAELWGSNHNKCRFLKNVRAFISMGKFDKLSLRELMWKMRVNDCVWLRLVKGDHFVPAYEHCFREELLAKFLYWLMDTYVVELLRSFFYITETMFQKNMLFYYRKLIWGKLQNIGIRNHFAKVHLRALSSEEFEAIHQKKNVPMASRLRFIPKPNGLRPIVKVSSVVEARAFSKESREKKVHHYNTQLKNLFSVLNYERTINTSFLGSSVFGKDDIFKIWKKFVTKVLQSDGEIPHFYYVKADVSRAYDTIPHNKLVEVISQILKPEKRTVYCIRRYAVIKITASGKARKFYKRHVSTFNDFMPDMKQFVSQLQESDSLQNAIVVEQSLSFNETSSSLFTFFLQMLHNNILEIGRRYYLQCCGIPQGSILSTLLCSLCYGDMENKLLCGIQQDGVLIRLIDDFLLVTPHLTQARTFLSYTGTSIRSSLSFNSSRTAGKNMKYKLITVLKLKCHCLFLDLQINSLRTVFINIYKIFLLQAYRFHACVLQLPFNQQVRNNPYFFLRIISETASCCYSILKAKNAGIPLGNKGATGVFPSEAAEWLCYHAFTVKLANHKVVYKCLLKPLKICKMQLFRKIPKDTMALLKTVTEPSLCQDFKAILD